MKAFKRVTSILLVLALVFSLAGCGRDNTWIAKKGDTSIPVGVYIYYLDTQAYKAKMEKVADKTIPVLDQEIDGQPAGEWIKQEAQKDVKQIIVANEWMEEVGAEVSQEDQNQAKGLLNQYWEMYYKQVYEPMGIASNSFYIATDLQSMKEAAIFKAVYDKGGDKEVPKNDVVDYYLKNYYNISKISVPLTNPQTGEALSEEDVEMLQTALTEYASQLEDGKSIEEIKASYEAAVNSASSEIASDTDSAASESASSETTSSDDASSGETSSEGTSSDSASPQDAANIFLGTAQPTFTESLDVKVDPENKTDADKTIQDMKTGDVKIINSGTELYVCVKHDTKDTKEAFYDNEDSRMAVLIELKQEEFLAELEKRAEAVEGVEFNEAALQKYKASSPEVDSSTPESSDTSSVDASSAEESSASESSDVETDTATSTASE